MKVIKTYGELFALDKKGKVRIFTLEILEDGENYRVKSGTGVVGGAISYSNTIIRPTSARRGNTTQGQAFLVADAAWKNKTGEGYKSRMMLTLYANAKGLSLVNDTEDITEAFNKLSIKFNTNPMWRPLPMLAEKWKTFKKKVKYPAYVQPKLNGVRATASYDVDQDEVCFDSRGGERYRLPFLEANLKPFFRQNQNIILDGEIYVHGKPLQEISGAARRYTDQPDWLEYHVYDAFNIKNLSEPYLSRWNTLKGLFDILVPHTLAYTEKVDIVATATAMNEEDVKTYHDFYVSEGYEGAIVRAGDGLYEVGFRSSSLLKVKEFEDEEFEILGSEYNRSRGIGESFVFILKNNIDEQTFKARPTGYAALKEYYHENIDKFKGKKATLRFQERSEGGLPIQGHIRLDLSKDLDIEHIRPEGE